MITEVHTPTEGSFSGQKHLRMLTLVAADIDNHPVDQYGNRYMVHINCSFLVFYWLRIRSAYSGKEISNQSDTGVVILFDGSPKKKTSGHIDLDFKCIEIRIASYIEGFYLHKIHFLSICKFATPVVLANSGTCIVVGH